jgi:hypothetical protein
MLNGLTKTDKKNRPRITPIARITLIQIRAIGVIGGKKCFVTAPRFRLWNAERPVLRLPTFYPDAASLFSIPISFLSLAF